MSEDRHRHARARGRGSEALSGGRSARRVPLDLRGLGGRAEVFRIAPGRRRDPAVERWLAADTSGLRAIARTWFARMRRCGGDVVELVHDGCPVACIGDAPVAYVNVFKSHANVGFFNGAALRDPQGLLEGSGKHLRHVKLRPEREADATAVGALIEAAYADLKARLAELG